VLAELLFWPALVAYAEAALSFAGHARSPGRAGRFATWGVRIGWLFQSALIGVQAERADGFPWTSWGGSLHLFVWLTVAGYLVWGCTPKYRLLGLIVMPLVVAMLLAAWAGDGTGTHAPAGGSTAFLVLHVTFVLVAFAGFTMSAGLSGIYLWQERALKRRRAGVLRLSAPSLMTLETLITRTILVGLPCLTVGIVTGLIRLGRDGVRFDTLMIVTLVTWAIYAAFLLLRFEGGWRGRRAAYLALVGFALVLVVRLALPAAHFS
jgi:ABC-type uncharacterized transport system permease subunit